MEQTTLCFCHKPFGKQKKFFLFYNFSPFSVYKREADDDGYKAI